jgi:hypothetical protein
MQKNQLSCVKCGSTKNPVFHHISYNPETIEILCSSCHQKVHGTKKKVRPEHFVSKLPIIIGATIRVSEENKAKLDALLAKKIGETKNPSLTMDEVITALLFIAEVKS